MPLFSKSTGFSRNNGFSRTKPPPTLPENGSVFQGIMAFVAPSLPQPLQRRRVFSKNNSPCHVLFSRGKEAVEGQTVIYVQYFRPPSGSVHEPCRDARAVRPLKWPCTCIHFSKPFTSYWFVTSPYLIVNRAGTIARTSCFCCFIRLFGRTHEPCVPTCL